MHINGDATAPHNEYPARGDIDRSESDFVQNNFWKRNRHLYLSLQPTWL